MFNSFFHFFLNQWLKTCVQHTQESLIHFVCSVKSQKTLLAGEPCVIMSNEQTLLSEKMQMKVYCCICCFASNIPLLPDQARQTDDHRAIKCNCLHLTVIIEFQDHCSEIEHIFHADISNNFLYISLSDSNWISDDKEFMKSHQQAIQNNIDQERRE